MAGVQSTNHRLLLIDMNLAHNVFIADILCEKAVLFAVYCTSIVYILLCFAVHSAVNVDKVTECHRYTVYIKTAFSNKCSSKIVLSFDFHDAVVLLIGNTGFNE